MKFARGITHNSKPISQDIFITKLMKLLTIADLPEIKIDDKQLIYYTIHNGTPRYVTQKKIYTIKDANILETK